MASTDSADNGREPIPKPNVQALALNLKNGRLRVSNALARINTVIHATLESIKDHAEEQERLEFEKNSKLGRMEKMVNDLSEKCQSMQQAILYKDEKYDEKCREVERYKVICELSSKAAVGDNQYYQGDSDNDDGHSYGAREVKDFVKKEPAVVEPRRNVKEHTKLNESQVYMSRYVDPLKPENSGASGLEYEDNESDQIKPSDYYVGGPCRRKIPINTQPSREGRRLESIGGINVRNPSSYASSFSGERVMTKPTADNPNSRPNKRLRMDLTTQRDEMMSSSDLASQMKKKFVEKSLQQQIAEGSWTRFSNRKRKDWPF